MFLAVKSITICRIVYVASYFVVTMVGHYGCYSYYSYYIYHGYYDYYGYNSPTVVTSY